LVALRKKREKKGKRTNVPRKKKREKEQAKFLHGL